MRVIIVDDEPFARQSIICILVNKFKSIEIVGEADSVSSAVSMIKELSPDLVFLDIDLNDGTGFDIINFLKPLTFKVVFITAHQEYAIKAIKFSALDYILKPVSSFELEAAVSRIIAEGNNESNQIQIDAFINNMQSKKDNNKIVLKTCDSIHLIDIDKIIRCEADNNYTTFFIQGSKKIIISKGLKEYDELLSTHGFFRVHQSHLINISNISRFDKKEGGCIVLSDDVKIPVSQRKRQKLLEIFEKYKQ